MNIYNKKFANKYKFYVCIYKEIIYKASLTEIHGESFKVIKQL